MDVPIWEKSLLTLKEAASYFNIGINKLRDLTDEKFCEKYVLFNGRSRLVKRKMFEEFLNQQFSI